MENPIEKLITEVYDANEKFGKGGLKLLAVCLVLQGVNWELVDKFALKWEVVEAGSGPQPTKMPVPIVYLTMKDGSSKSFVGDEDELKKE
jgi:hypothetical protein